MAEKITSTCAVSKVTTMADGSKRVYLDFPEDTAFEMAQLMECQRLGVYLNVTFEPVEEQAETSSDKRESRKTKF